ncbi:MAG: MerR family DNA-binding transcriptional regulator [Brevibacillus sp.]|nr:MerR family DNA-binding transcriptional regulator [Brevibacillus sp.]
MSKGTDWFSISDLAQELDISTRTIRYYEEVGLIRPARTKGGMRMYTRGDRARLRLILRGKRFGFSLEQIKEMIDLFQEDRTGRKQLERTIAYGREKLQEIEQRMEELKLLRDEIVAYMKNFEQRLREESTVKPVEDQPTTSEPNGGDQA